MTDENQQNIEKELAECKAKVDEYLNGWKRAQADLINYKKEEDAQMENAIKFANVSLLLRVMGLFDEVDIALSHAPQELELGHKEWFAGVKNLKQKFENFLAKQGVEKVKTVGENFNPLEHESVGEAEGGESGTVMEELQAGYRMHGRIIRPAKVRIAK